MPTDAFASGPVTAPMLAMPVTSQAQRVTDQLAAEGRPEPDDIPEPEVPVEASRIVQEPATPSIPVYRPGEYEALLQGFCGHLQKKLDDHILSRYLGSESALKAMCDMVTADVKALVQSYVASNAARQEGYTVQIQAMSPNGYPFTLTITKATKDDARSELIDTAIWLADNGCKMA